MLYYRLGSYHHCKPCNRFIFLHSALNQNDHHLNKSKSPLGSIFFCLLPVCFTATFSDMETSSLPIQKLKLQSSIGMMVHRRCMNSKQYFILNFLSEKYIRSVIMDLSLGLEWPLPFHILSLVWLAYYGVMLSLCSAEIDGSLCQLFYVQCVSFPPQECFCFPNSSYVMVKHFFLLSVITFFIYKDDL